MKPTPIEFRFRFLIHAIIFFLGFTAPWDYYLHWDSIRTWQYLAAVLARTGAATFSNVTILVLIFAIAFALLSALLRTWATAYLSPAVVHDRTMHGDQVVAAGPYRFLRNPLYLGIILHTFALAILMPPTGALFTIVTVTLFQLRLISVEEFFLTQKLGEPYRAYCAKVPLLIPSLTPRVPPPPQQPHWANAFLGEIYFWGVVLTFAIFGWRYNSQLLIKGVIISLGLSLIVRAFLPQPKAAATTD
jgi:protein-S-isoprenylcysteine O-methyltransferase Ste14